MHALTKILVFHGVVKMKGIESSKNSTDNRYPPGDWLKIGSKGQRVYKTEHCNCIKKEIYLRLSFI